MFLVNLCHGLCYNFESLFFLPLGHIFNIHLHYKRWFKNIVTFLDYKNLFPKNTINNKNTSIMKNAMKKVPQFLISLELWNKKLPNCQAISKLNAYFDPIKGDLIRVLVNDIKSSYSYIISSVSFVDAIILA